MPGVIKLSAAGAPLGVTLQAAGMNAPSGVAVDAAGNVYVADSSAAAVFKFNAAGSLVGQASVGSQPYGIAVDPVDGRVAVSDYVDRLVHLLDAGLNPLGSFGQNVLGYPIGVAFGPGGSVWVGDRGDSTVRVFSCPSATGTPTPSATPSASPSATVTLTGSPTPTPSASPTASSTPAGTVTATPSASPSPSSSATSSPAVTATPSPTPNGWSCGTVLGQETTTENHGHSDFMVASPFDLSVTSSVRRLELLSPNNSGGGAAYLAIYDDAGGRPGMRLAFGNAQLPGPGYQWFGVSIPPLLLAPGRYWLMTDSNAMISMAFGDNSAGTYIARYPFAPPPADAAGLASSFVNAYPDKALCIRALDCSAGPTESPTHSPTTTPSPAGTFTATPSPAPYVSACGYAFGQTGQDNTEPIAAGFLVASYYYYGGGTINALSVQFMGASPTGTFRVGLYQEVSGTPGSLLAQSGDVPAQAGWATAPLPDSPLAAGYYWIAVNLSDPNDLAFKWNGLNVYKTLPYGPLPAALSGYSYNEWESLAAVAAFCPHTPTPTSSPTPSSSPTATPSATPSASPTGTPSPSATASATVSPTRTPTATGSPTATGTPSGTATPTLSPTGTRSPTKTATPTGTATPTVSPTGAPTLTETASPTATATPTISATWTVTVTATSTLTGTGTRTLSPTRTATPTPTASPTVTLTLPPTSTPTPTVTVSPVLSATPSLSPTLGGNDLPPVIQAFVAVPNPNPRWLLLRLAGRADTVEFKTYSPALVAMDRFRVSGLVAGWNRVALPPAFTAGLYYIRASARRRADVEKPAVCRAYRLP